MHPRLTGSTPSHPTNRGGGSEARPQTEVLGLAPRSRHRPPQDAPLTGPGAGTHHHGATPIIVTAVTFIVTADTDTEPSTPTESRSDAA